MVLLQAGRHCLFAFALAVPLACLPANLQYVIETVAGTSDAGDGGPARAAQLGSAEGIALDPAGNL
jgi:hypothetical protein